MKHSHKNNQKLIYRWVIYISGLIILALGITLNTKCGLGVSPIISVAYSFSLITGIKIGNTTFILYGVFVLLQIIIHFVKKFPKRQYILDVLQIALSMVFTRFMNLFSDFVPQLDEVYENEWQGSMPFRIFVLLIAIILTGIGAAMSLNMRLIPNPGDGIVQTVADTIHKSVGFSKNCWDVIMIAITTAVTLFCYTKIASTPGNAFLSVIGIGTVIAVIGVGRVIAVFNHFAYDKMTSVCGLKENKNM